MNHNEVDKPILQSMHELILDMFKNACEAIVAEGLDEHSYKFSENTIKLTLEYLKAKRLP